MKSQKFSPFRLAELYLKVFTALRLALAMLLLSFLTACGGGNSSSDMTDTTPIVSTTPGTSNPVSGNTPASVPLIITPGAYLSKLNDWVLILIRSQQGSGATSQFFGLNYKTADPDIYSGSGLIAGIESAVLANVVLFQNTFATVHVGSGTVVKTNENNLTASFTFPAKGSVTAAPIPVTAVIPANYQYNIAPTQTSVQGTWQGRLSYGLGFSDNFTLVVSSQGVVSSSLTFQQDCRITQSTLLPNFDGTNLFAWNLTIPNATQCSFKNQVLSGAAVITTSPVPGKTQRIYAVAISPDGRGVSFRADR